jgi:hypothetical protein
VDAAIKLANECGKEGKPGVVLFQKSKTEFEKIWTYGESAGEIRVPCDVGTPEPRKLTVALG